MKFTFFWTWLCEFDSFRLSLFSKIVFLISKKIVQFEFKIDTFKGYPLSDLFQMIFLGNFKAHFKNKKILNFINLYHLILEIVFYLFYKFKNKTSIRPMNDYKFWFTIFGLNELNNELNFKKNQWFKLWIRRWTKRWIKW